MPDRRGEKINWRLYLHYLAPHKARLVFAFIAMVGVGFFGSFNFLLLKPALEVILSERAVRETITLTLAGDDGTTQTVTHPNVLRIERTEPARRADTKDLLQVGFLQRLKAGWDRALAPAYDWAHGLDQRLKAYGRENKRTALWIIGGLLVAMAAFHGVCDYLAQYEMTYTMLDMMRRLKDDLFRIVLRQDYLFFVRQTTGYLESRIQSDVGGIRTMIDVLLTDAVQAPLKLFFLLLVLLILNFQLTLVAAAVVPVALIPLIFFARAIRRVTRRSKREADLLNSTLEETLRNFKVVKCFQSEDFEAEKFQKHNLNLFRYFLARRIARFGASPVMEVLGALGGSAILLIGGALILKGRMDFSALMVYLLTLTQFYSPLKKISRINSVLQTGRISAERIQEMTRLAPELACPPDARPLPAIRRDIVFDNVTFIYDDQPVLRDLSFTVPVGKTIAVVGQSGAGKTTLACLLLRLFDPQAGRITIDGHDLRSYRLDDLRRRLSMVTQETILFNDSVARNVAYPDRQADPERVERAARLANAHEFILALDGGRQYDTVIGQAGLLLSGGQRQRIAIARAIYRDPDVLIFDEATSALDEKSQALVQEAINNLLRGRTAIIIAHRLSTVRNADEILVLERGRLAERGTHDDLIRRGGVYAALYQMIEAPA